MYCFEENIISNKFSKGKNRNIIWFNPELSHKKILKIAIFIKFNVLFISIVSSNPSRTLGILICIVMNI